jgi:GDP-4-dehydro-6-deoxy-D-mannose reductase
MKALITGIAGFAGNYLAQLLVEKGLEVYGISQEKEFIPFLSLDRSSLRYIPLDVRDRLGLSKVLSDSRPQLIFHLAARSSPSESTQHPEETYSVNFTGTMAALEAIRLQGLRCRFLLVSSSHVYGSFSGPVTEAGSLRPETPYAASKAAAEMAAYQYWRGYGIETVRVRAFNHSGPGQRPGFAGPDLARKVVEIERGCRPPRLELTNPNRRIDFSDVRDMVRGYYSALTLGLPGDVYNLCSGRGITVRSLAEGLVARARAEVRVVPAAQSAPAELAGGLVGDGSHALRDIEWKPSIPIERTLDDLLEYWRRQDWSPSHPISSLSKKDPCLVNTNTVRSVALHSGSFKTHE